MHPLVHGTPGAALCDLSFRDTRDWFSTTAVKGFPVEGGSRSGRRMAMVLLGDSDAGPLVSFGCRTPSITPPEKFPAHGHDSDTWRMPLLGKTSMGNKTFGPGEFRFWPGGRPYGTDDTAWGPAGGWNITMVGDRRGITMRTVDKSLQGKASLEATSLAELLGFRLPSDPPAIPGLSTTLDVSSRAGNCDDSFANGAAWPKGAPGMRAHVGLFGDHRLGPVMLLTSCDPGARFGAERFGTEALHIVASGSGRLGDRLLETGDIRLIAADHPHPELVVGPDGLCAITVFGDRSRLGDRHDRDWALWLVSVVHEIKKPLTAE